MMWLDFVLIAVLVLSVIYSIFRGFVREMLSLTGWVLAFWVAIKYAPLIATRLTGLIESPGIRFILAFIMLFFLILVSCMLLARVIARLIRWGGLRNLDRVIGAGFGLARGVVIVTLLVMLGGMSPLSAEPAWQQSKVVDVFQKFALWASDKLPDDVVNQVRQQTIL